MKRRPKSLRVHIGIFGRTNTGKSTFLNYITAQNVAITSPIPGTTTDVVEKTMELPPVGPVVFLDTAGIDDISVLASARFEKTQRIFKRADIFLLLTEAGTWGEYEESIVEIARKNQAPLIVLINKSDLSYPSTEFIEKLRTKTSYVIISSCIDTEDRERIVSELKKALIKVCPESLLNLPPLINDLLPPAGLIMMVVPLDLQAPKGRLILPQTQTIREALDNRTIVTITKETELKAAVIKLKEYPDLVVCDSQVIEKVVNILPPEVKCTTFSILFSRYKGDLNENVRAVRTIDKLKAGSKILIAESCSHHPIQDDIGRVKIPQWIKRYTGIDAIFDVSAGRDFPPDNLKDYDLIIHCGGCMLTRREMLARMQQAKEITVPITNYGVCIAFLQGVLERALSPFPQALTIYKEEMECKV